MAAGDICPYDFWSGRASLLGLLGNWMKTGPVQACRKDTGVIEFRKLSPAVATMPALASLPEDFRGAFFGGLDYASIGRKL